MYTRKICCFYCVIKGKMVCVCVTNSSKSFIIITQEKKYLYYPQKRTHVHYLVSFLCFDLNNHYFSSYFTFAQAQLNVLSLHPLSQSNSIRHAFYVLVSLKKISFPALKCGNY